MHKSKLSTYQSIHCVSFDMLPGRQITIGKHCTPAVYTWMTRNYRDTSTVYNTKVLKLDKNIA